MKIVQSIGLAVITAFILISCLEGSINAQENAATLLGKWNIVADSTFIGVGSNNHAVNYSGHSGDYFDCRVDGNIYIKEGAILDTLSYNLISDTTIIIESFGINLNGTPETSHITNLSLHAATVNAPLVITPGGEFGRVIHLSR